jgi:hypothetical protein
MVGPPAAAVLLGLGAIAVTLDPSRARLTVRAPYQRATLVGAPAPGMPPVAPVGSIFTSDGATEVVTVGGT